jgi:hypothetical protein
MDRDIKQHIEKGPRVFIGMLREMKRDRIVAMLERCLADPVESGHFDPNVYRDLLDPFPQWGQEA